MVDFGVHPVTNYPRNDRFEDPFLTTFLEVLQGPSTVVTTRGQSWTKGEYVLWGDAPSGRISWTCPLTLARCSRCPPPSDQVLVNPQKG